MSGMKVWVVVDGTRDGTKQCVAGDGNKGNVQAKVHAITSGRTVASKKTSMNDSQSIR